MLNTIVEDSLKNIKGRDRFKLVHEAIKLAKSAAVHSQNMDSRSTIWALKKIAEGHYQAQEGSDQA